jgi:hypothetical protein
MRGATVGADGTRGAARDRATQRDRLDKKEAQPLVDHQFEPAHERLAMFPFLSLRTASLRA